MFSRAGGIKSLPPVDEATEDGYDEPFPLQTLVAPTVTGAALKIFLALAEGPFFGPVRTQLLRSNKMPQILEELFIPERPTFRPNTAGWPAEGGGTALVPAGSQDQPAADRATAAAALLPGFAAAAAAAAADGPVDGTSGGGTSGGGKRPYTAADFHRAYATGACTPSDVAENIIAAVAASEAMSPPMRFLVAHEPQRLRQQAAASTARWQQGRPLSPLDGVPYAVKDGCDALPYPTTTGTGFMAEWRTPVRSLAGVQALLDAGALLIGKANLHEIGLGTTGLNILTGTPRNPHSPAHHTGGSSSGSAALVAAGLCPFAVGSDGGGSIRIPAAACGVVGLKPTHERVGTAVGTPPIDQTVSVVGPLAASVQDCALMYAVAANTGQRPGEAPPPVLLPAALGGGGRRPLAGKTAGVCWEWFEDAASAVAEACRSAVAMLEGAGLAVVPLRLPELGLLRAAHSCTIASEMRNNMAAALSDGGARRRMNAETRISLAVAAGFQAAHYIQAQKIRTRVEAHFRSAFARCDLILTPTLPCTAPPIKPAALQCGETDLTTTTALMHYMLAPNFIGLPAISVPVGVVPSTHPPAPSTPAPGAGAVDGGGASPPLLPVALQLMAPCWHEASLLHAAAVLEAAVASAGKAPPLPAVWYDVLSPPHGTGAADGR